MKRALQMGLVGIFLGAMSVAGYGAESTENSLPAQDEQFSAQVHADPVEDESGGIASISTIDEEADVGSVILDSDSDAESFAEPDPLADEDPGDSNAMACPPQGRQCIVYLQPHPSSDLTKENPLYPKVRTFIRNNSHLNEEAGFPPHISMIGFFPCPTTPSVNRIKNSITQTLASIGKPLGRPSLERIKKVVTASGKRSLRITVSDRLQTRNYFRRVISNLLFDYPTAKCATRFPVSRYHISLALGNYSKAQLNALATKAHTAFDPLHQWNVDTPPKNSWDIVLYRSANDSTPPLARLRRWRIN